MRSGFAAAWWFRLRGRELRPEEACQNRFSWFSNWSPKVQKCVNHYFIFDSVLFSQRRINVHLVDLVKSFPTSIYLQKSASKQPRTSLSKFGGKFNSLFMRLLSYNTRSSYTRLATTRVVSNKLRECSQLVSQEWAATSRIRHLSFLNDQCHAAPPSLELVPT